MSGEGEEMVVIFKIGPWNAEQGLSSDQFEDEAAETPDVLGSVDGSVKNQLRSSQAEGGDGFCRRVRKEICYSGR